MYLLTGRELLAAWALLLGLTAGSALAGEPAAEAPPPPRPRALAPLRLPAEEAGPAWNERQFLGSTRAGAVFVLDPERLRVWPLSGRVAERRLGELSEIPPPSNFDSVGSAALRPDGEAWAVLADGRVSVVEDGRAREVDALQWLAMSVAWVGDTLVATVVPRPVGHWDEVPEVGEDPPLVLEHQERGWRVLATGEDLDEAEQGDPFPMRWTRAASVSADSRGRLWVFDHARYRIRHFSPGGRLLMVLTVDGGKIRQVSESAQQALHKELLDNLRSAGWSEEDLGKGKVHANTTETVLSAAAEGRDGSMCFLVHRGATEDLPGSWALDRWDAVTQTLQRLPLDADWPGRPQMAAGRDGLFFASPGGQAGSRAFLPWESLEEADWRPVPEVEIGGATPP